jgi:cytochrome c oxidase subunit 2
MSTLLLAILVLALLFIVVIQISKTSDLIGSLKKDNDKDNHSKGALYLSIVGFAVLAYSILASVFSTKKLLPVSASEQGVWIDNVMNVTIFFTGIVFIITQFLLFYFVYKYHYRKERKATFFSDSNKLEIAWTIVPAIVLTALVGMGLQKWLKIFSPAPTEAITIEATAKQFGWVLRYPGADNKLGIRDFTLVNPDNELGINWGNKSSHDDMLVDELVLPVNKPVLVNIAALDVIHNFYLPEFRVMMDAVPGIPTKFWFTPTITTEEMRVIRNNPKFDYVMTCNQLCGSGHYNMKKKVRIVSDSEYKKWLSEQKSYYESVVKPALADKGISPETVFASNSGTTDVDASFSFKLPNSFELIGAKSGGVENKLVDFIKSNNPVSKELWFSFDRLLFETGKATLKLASQEQLTNIAEILKAFPNVELKLGGYTDNVGKPEANLKLSTDRANNVMNELIKMGVAGGRLKAEGYGQEHPVASNDTDEGRQQNRRIDVRVTKK